MEPEGRIIEKINLANGLELIFYDQSRQLVGNRWQVKLLILIPLDVKESYFDELDDPHKAFDRFIAVTGPALNFRADRLRNFIDGSDVNEALEELKTEFLQSNLNYLSRPDFARKFILKKYHELQEQNQLKELYAKHLKTSPQ